MQRKFRNRTQLRSRLGLRTVMNAVVLFSLVFIFSSVFIVQLLKDETGNAASNPMVIANIEVSQDTIPVYRGSNRQLMLKINVITKGNSNKLNFNAITLAARGSSPGAIDLIRNARLWYTGNESHFSPMKQIGSTLETISKNNFIISAQKTLQEGSNYFWLTYDFSNSQIHGQHFADAECIAVRIGTLDYNPPVAAPPGKRKVLQNKPYFSTGNGDISSLTSWNTNRDGSGDTPHNFNELSATFSVQPGHIMKNTLSACLPVLIIENGGVLSSTSDIITNQMDVFNGGTYIQNKIITSHTNIKQLNIQNNGNYIHNNK